MKNGQDLTDADIERSQAFLGAVLGADEEGNLPPDHQIGANNPPEPIVAPEDKRIAELIANADAWAEQYPIIDDEPIGKEAAGWLEQLEKELKSVEQKFKEEKAPHEEKLAEIRGKFHPRIERLKICLQSIRPRFRAWIKLRDDRVKAAREAEKRKAEEAQRRADQLAEQAKAGGPNAVSQTIVALEATQEAERARQVVAAMPQRARVRSSLGGRTHSLRTVWYADIREFENTLEHYKGRREVRELLQTLANADVRNPRLWKNPEDRYIPGCHCYSEQV